MMNLSTCLEYSAQQNPNKTAIIFGEKQFTFGEVNAISNMIANGLKESGIKKGDKVALTCPNLPFFPMAYYGILKAGATVVPMNVLLKGREIAYHLKDSDAKAYFCFEGTAELPMAQEGYKGFKEVDSCTNFWVITANPAAPSPIPGTKTLGQLMAKKSPLFTTVVTDPTDTAVILYTSGTTGFPKGAELSHSNMTMNAMVARNLLQLTHEDIHILTLPLFHSFGQTVQMNAGFSMSNTLILIPRFDPALVLDAIQNKGASVFGGVPTMYWALCNYEDKEGRFNMKTIAKNLRIGISGGASLSVEIINQMERIYNIPVLEGYGLSETSPVVTFNQLHKQRKPGSIGTTIWGVDVKIIDSDNKEVAVGEVGEIAIKGHNVMKGYYNKPEETKKAIDTEGWFHSGDLGRKDEEGYVFIVDRVKDMIIRGGYNIYPRELEEVLMTHPDVSMAAVIGVSHPQHGEEVKACIVPKNGNDLNEKALIKWCKENMASYKYPRIIEIMSSLPMTATGKILKKELKATVKTEMKKAA